MRLCGATDRKETDEEQLTSAKARENETRRYSHVAEKENCVTIANQAGNANDRDSTDRH